jgi:hypothetical protein
MLANKYQVTSIKEATREVILALREDLGEARAIIPINQDRYNILVFDTESVLIMYKREMYLSFEEGRGETINKNDLETAIDKFKIKRIFVVYADSKIYCISPHTVLAQGIERTTEAEDKPVYSFPVKLLIRYNEFKEVLNK